MNNTGYHKFLRNPSNLSKLELQGDELVDTTGKIFPIVNNIPRFVEASNYSNSFGYQWNLFTDTQIDKFSKNHITEERFYKNTKWTNSKLKDKYLLEVGSGAGRFTEVLLKTGTKLFSIDYSNAVEANKKNNGNNDFLLAQASVYELPFEFDFFDYILCFGVIQHTPNVEQSFKCMIDHLKPGGEIAIDVYANNFKTKFYTKYWVRPFTKRINKKKLLKFINWYVPKWLPFSNFLLKVPYIGKFLAQIIPVVNYSIQFPFLEKKQQIEWSILDTFDMLSPEYDQPQKLTTLEKWVVKYNLEKIYCGKGDNGYVLIAKKK